MLTYLGLKEILINQPIVLLGTYNPQPQKTIALVAEDRYPLAVNLSPHLGIWYVRLTHGFNTPGERWLRLTATVQYQVVDEQIFSLTVKTTRINIGTSFLLSVIQDTILKQQPVNADQLTAEQQQAVQAGQLFQINDYQVIKDHLQVKLTETLPNIGQFGYFYLPHIFLSYGSSILWFDAQHLPLSPPGTQLLWVNQRTFLKSKPDDSSQLSPSQMVELNQGSTYILLGYACVANHFRITLTQEIPGFGKSGYAYRYHVRLFQNNAEIVYNDNAINLLILNTTPFKKQPIDVAYLPETEQVMLPNGKIYGVQSYAIEQGHLKVALTENIPEFGDTGYLYPDFVQLTRGGVPFSPAFPLSYQGPQEVLVNQFTVLKGTFDSKTTTEVIVIAEDRYPFNVTLNRQAGTWQVMLKNGFIEPGYRWLRLKAIDENGQIIASQLVDITVSTNPMTVEQALQLDITTETLFKSLPVDSSALNSEQKTILKADQTFTVLKYGLVDGHLKVLLENSIPPIGSFGYIYVKHVTLRKGEDVLNFDFDQIPDTDISAKLWITQTTFIKAQAADSSSLKPNQISQLSLGQTLAVRGYACTQGHFRVTLTESIPGFGNVGYVYWQHVRLVREGKEIPYNPDAITMIVGKTTVLKKAPKKDNQLSSSEQVTLPAGRVYGINSYNVNDGHVKVALTEELPNFGNTGYVFPEDVQFQKGGKPFNPVPPYLELSIPYFSQRDNPRFSWSTCNVTSIAMAMFYHGVRSQFSGQLEDELLQWCFNYAGAGAQTDHNVLSALIQAYGFKTSFTTTRRWSQVKEELVNRRPVVLAGDFTPSGHIVTLIGYNNQGYIVNDPWGDAYTGYSNTEGRRILYSYTYLNQVAGPDGNVWAHFISR